MSFKFKFAKKRKNPTKPQEGDQWHAIPVTTNRLTTRSLCKVVTRNTTTAPTEAESTFNLVCDGIVHELQQGSSVQLGELGWLRLSFGSEGVEDLTQFDAASMIRNVKIIFTPSKNGRGRWQRRLLRMTPRHGTSHSEGGTRMRQQTVVCAPRPAFLPRFATDSSIILPGGATLLSRCR